MSSPSAGKSPVRAVTVLVCFLLLLTQPLAAGGRRRAVAVSTLLDDLSITIVQVTAPGVDALLETGAIVHQPSEKRGLTTTRHQFGLRVGAPSQSARGMAVLRASLETGDARIAVRIDGVELGPVPRVIDAQAPVGLVLQRNLEITVPPDMPEGTLALTINWEAVTEP